MKLLQLNASVGRGSTGKIAETIAHLATMRGWECYIAHGSRYIGKTQMETYQVSNKATEILHYAKSILFDAQGLGSVVATRRFVKWIDNLKPDIIHLHNIHGYWLNYEILFEYFQQINIPIVWTLHDCWAFTGHCAMFTSSFCDKWKVQCENCPHLDWYPKSLFIDRSYYNYTKKRSLFSNLANLTIVSVSNWLNGIVEQSYLKSSSHLVITNGVDTRVFYPRTDAVRSVREKFGLEDKIIVLSVADKWNEGIGFSDIPKLRELLDDRFAILLVGVTQNQKEALPAGVIGVLHTNSRDELAELYTAADISFMPQVIATFGLVCAESLACGTPAVVYAPAAAEVIGENGFVVPARDVRQLASAIKKFASEGGKEKYHSSCVERVQRNYDESINYNKYIDLYESLI